MPWPVERIYARSVRVDRGHETPCLIWPTINGQGYGQITVGSRLDGTRRNRRTHIVTWEAAHGPVPAGLELDHRCRQRDCCEATHLEAVTDRVNTLRGIGPAARWAARDRCDQGHPFDGRNGKYRRCLTCHRDRERERRQRAVSRP